MSRPPTRDLLIDVRSPAEYSTGHLTSDLSPTPTLNIPYQDISSLAAVYAARGVIVDNKTDRITLYCRSGRRSDIAARELRELGYGNVRDIGGFEEARRVLDKEVVERQLGLDARDEQVDGKGEGEGEKHKRVKSFGALV